ncbi:MAG: hypothetical protein KDA60_22095, partial [Planctomycetales bacterium]|nr:hypothetical protein [Planctomycetales bacterium]
MTRQIVVELVTESSQPSKLTSSEGVLPRQPASGQRTRAHRPGRVGWVRDRSNCGHKLATADSKPSWLNSPSVGTGKVTTVGPSGAPLLFRQFHQYVDAAIDHRIGR